MTRCAVVLLVACAVPSVGAAPVPKHLAKGAPLYAPTTVGTKRVYEHRGAEQVLIVTKVENRNGKTVVSVEREDNGKRVADDVVEVSEAGLIRTHWAGIDYDPPLVLVQGPVRVGESWAVKTTGIKGTKKAAAVETIKVPAGTFEAVRIESEYGPATAPSKSTAWYAPNVGLIKVIEGDGTVAWLLKAFEPAKAKE